MPEYWSNAQKENLAFFKKELKNFLQNELYKGKFIIIHDKQVKGIFDTFEAAINFAVSKYPRNEFVIQQVIDESDTINFLFSALNFNILKDNGSFTSK